MKFYESYLKNNLIYSKLIYSHKYFSHKSISKNNLKIIHKFYQWKNPKKNNSTTSNIIKSYSVFKFCLRTKINKI